VKWQVTFRGSNPRHAIGALATHGVQTVVPAENGDPRGTPIVAVVHADDAASAWQRVSETLGEGYTLFAVTEARGRRSVPFFSRSTANFLSRRASPAVSERSKGARPSP
jgi:hypothetical protein